MSTMNFPETHIPVALDPAAIRAEWETLNSLRVAIRNGDIEKPPYFDAQWYKVCFLSEMLWRASNAYSRNEVLSVSNHKFA
jgi:hypothetical protein